MTIALRPITPPDVAVISAAFTAIGWHKPISIYERYLAEQTAGSRIVLVALDESIFIGYITIHWLSNYPPFRADSIPEITDFNVLPDFRRRGIGSRLMDEAEQIAAQRSPVVGIGVGLYADYGAAQRMYARRGYIPDGRGVFFRGHTAQPGETVVVDDDLLLFFTKVLHKIR